MMEIKLELGQLLKTNYGLLEVIECAKCEDCIVEQEGEDCPFDCATYGNLGLKRVGTIMKTTCPNCGVTFEVYEKC